MLVLPIEEISFWPELSSPPRFRIQGRYPERHKVTKDERKQIHVSNIGFDLKGDFKTALLKKVSSDLGQQQANLRIYIQNQNSDNISNKFYKPLL